MDGEQNGTQSQQDAQQQEQGQQQAAQQPQQETQQATGASGTGKPTGNPAGTPGAGGATDSTAYEAQLAKRDKRVAELETQIADAAKTAEAAKALRGEIAKLKAQGESERVDFKLQLAGVRNVKAARAILGDHAGDIDALKAAEPWLFQDAGQKQQAGKTGLPNAGTATDSGKQLKHFMEIAGVDDSE